MGGRGLVEPEVGGRSQGGAGGAVSPAHLPGGQF